jgi:hypothetical protein
LLGTDGSARSQEVGKKGGPVSRDRPSCLYVVRYWVLEAELQFGLNYSRRRIGAQPRSEGRRGRIDGGHDAAEQGRVADVRDRSLEIGMVEHVVELRTESNLPFFPARNFGLLHKREVAVEVVGATELVTRHIAKARR